MSTITRTTRREAKEAVDTFVSLYLSNQGELVTPETIDTIVLALSSDLQVRDYLLGLPIEHTLEGATEAIEIMATFFPEGNRKALNCVLSSYYYEAGNLPTCSAYLAKALDEDSTYPLAGLLTRVFNAGWPTQAWAKMRDEVHPKVLEGLDDTSIPEME